MRAAVVVGIVALATGPASAQPGALPAPVRAIASRRTSPITIDGKLDDAAWKTAAIQHGFTQRFPRDGGPATFDTRFAVLYDDAALYIAVWADDPEPALIRHWLTRRDIDAPADSVMIGIDSYHDRRTGYGFQLNAAGVQRDLIMFDDTNQDATWDAVWTGATSVDAHGWTAEFRIPFNQLRFSAADAHDWGLQVTRVVGRTSEQSAWSPWPRSSPQVVSKFGSLGGIGQLPATRRLELLPYVTGGFDEQPVDAGDPLHHHWAARYGAGLDVKYGLGTAFTLSATINPDFGQVEADPSLVNLSANEVYLPEKRPFFTEGVDLFQLPIGSNDGNNEGQFYSRRIGGAPPNEPSDYSYIDWPAQTTIYGAAKLTGKTASGWSVGVLDALTGAASAGIVDDNGIRTDPQVAGLTNYAAGRVKHDFDAGRTSVGVSATAVDRDLPPEAGPTSLAATLHDQAYTAGAQLQTRFADDAWGLTLRAVGSWVHGTPDAIRYTEELPRHLFQRPDATDVSLDPTRTSLDGYGLGWSFGRIGNVRHWRIQWAGDLRSPGLELNDAGYQTAADRLLEYGWVQYREDAPSAHVLNWNLASDVYTINNFEPTLEEWGIESNGNITFGSYWTLSGYAGWARARWDPTLLRGGDDARVDPYQNFNASITTDNRKPLWFTLNTHLWLNPTTSSFETDWSLGATLQARSNIDMYFGPSYSVRSDAMQYVDEVPDASGDPQYIFARVHQVTAALTARVNWTFSPWLSLQAYAQPFIGTGAYSAYKNVDNPHAEAFGDRYQALGAAPRLDPAGYMELATFGGSVAVPQPDFDLRQLRSTVVLRWEYRPGSSIYLIWSHNRSDEISDGRFAFGRDITGLAETPGENVVMVKANYWFTP